MSHLDALNLVEKMRTRLVDLAGAENYVRNAAVADAASTIWRGPGAEGGLVSEIWVQGAFPAELSTDSLGSLAADGKFPRDLCDYLDRTGGFPAGQPLYSHQARAIRSVTGRRQVARRYGGHWRRKDGGVSLADASGSGGSRDVMPRRGCGASYSIR